MASKTKVARIEDIRAGKTLYSVCSLGDKSYIETMYLTSKPVPVCFGTGKPGKELRKLASQSSCRFVTYKTTCGEGTALFSNMHSLQDIGVLKNTYNTHKTFTTLNAAKRYLEKCKKLPYAFPDYHDDW